MRRPSTLPVTTCVACPDTPFIDTTDAFAHLGGLKHLYRRALVEFAKGLTNLPEKYVDAVASNMVQASELMHTTKCTAATLGAIQLSLQSAEQEKHCRDNPAVSATLDRVSVLNHCVALTQKSLKVVFAWLDGEKGSNPFPHPASPRAAVSTVRAVLDDLISVLAASGLRVFKVFAAHQGAWAALPQQDVAELERALQDLVMASAYGSCGKFLALLSTGVTNAG